MNTWLEQNERGIQSISVLNNYQKNPIEQQKVRQPLQCDFSEMDDW